MFGGTHTSVFIVYSRPLQPSAKQAVQPRIDTKSKHHKGGEGGFIAIEIAAEDHARHSRANRPFTSGRTVSLITKGVVLTTWSLLAGKQQQEQQQQQELYLRSQISGCTLRTFSPVDIIDRSRRRSRRRRRGFICYQKEGRRLHVL